MIRSMRHSGFDFRDIRSLVVEDEEFARTLTSQVLRSFGCASVHAVADGNQAIDVLTNATQSFDLVICDFRMPRMNGLELLKAVRKGLPGVARDIVFAMLTSHADKPIVGLAFQLDVDCFLIKPITASTMNERLVRVLSTERPIKSPLDYHETGLDSVMDLALSEGASAADVPSVVSATEDRGLATTTVQQARRVKLTEIRPGSVIAAPIKTGAGDVLLKAGSTLDRRTIDRLSDLAEIDPAVGMVQVAD